MNNYIENARKLPGNSNWSPRFTPDCICDEYECENTLINVGRFQRKIGEVHSKIKLESIRDCQKRKLLDNL